MPLQSFPNLLGRLSTLTAVELEHEQLPGDAIPSPGAMTELRKRLFQLRKLKPYPALALRKRPKAGRT